MKKYNIFIATPIYPPQIGGPAKYSEMLFNVFQKQGHDISVSSFGKLLLLPTGIRHFAYFIKILPKIILSDFIIVLDTYSACFPAFLAGKIFGKKIIVRTGGDFLWESYLERTKEFIKLSDFYKEKRNFNFKEQIIFKITKWMLSSVDALVFSTEYQKNIFISGYSLSRDNIFIIENLYLQNKKRNIVPKEKIFFSPSRNIFIKNKDNLKKAFSLLSERFFDIKLETDIKTGESFIKKMEEVYCLIVPSISEISPNIVLDALSYGIPVILTEDCGIKNRISSLVIFINPEDPISIKDGMEKILDAKEYSEYMSRISKFNFVHSENDIANEFLNVFEKIK